MQIPRPLPGFSLIELLVVITISLLLVGGAIAALTTYADKRTVGSAAEELKTYFQSAQARAGAGDLGGCTQLAGYRVQTYLVGNVTNLTLQADCAAGTADEAQTYTLAAGISVSPNLDVLFQVLNGGVALDGGAASQDITVTNGTQTYQFSLSREGRVSEGVWE